jgi:predicted alpha/beta superfamily hydrolase
MAAPHSVPWTTAALAMLMAPPTAPQAPAPAPALAAPAAAARVDGDLRLEAFTSATFGNVRMLRILLPYGYDAAENRARHYPVLYLNDGQNLFEAATSTFTGREWRVDETVGRLTASGRLPPMIVVGIDHGGRRERFREYFPWADAFLQPPEPAPQGGRYPTFLVDEVLPFVEARYRVAREPAQRGIGGSSAGGLAAINAVVTRPGVFGRLLVESPSIYVDDAHILKTAAGVTTWPDRVFLGAGTMEGPPRTCRADDSAEPEVVTDLRRFAAVLRRAGVADARVRIVVTACAAHDEDAWAARLPDALAFLYAHSVGSTRPRR